MSQCRIRVEMAFGMMVNRFGVLRSPLRVSILNIGPLMQSIARLHNFLLNENNEYDPHQRQPSQDMPLLPRNAETGQETNGNPAQPVDGISVICEALVHLKTLLHWFSHNFTTEFHHIILWCNFCFLHLIFQKNYARDTRVI